MGRLENPTKNIQFLLYALDKLQPAKGRIQLYKIHYLIEKEGHVKYDMPIDQYPLGPVDYLSINYCMENELIKEEPQNHFGYTMYSIYLTQKGKEYLEKTCLPQMNKNEIRKADGIIEKYKNKSGTEILEHVHKNYVDKYKENMSIKEMIEGFQKNIPVYIDLAKSNLEKAQTVESQDKLFSALGYLEHVSDILERMHSVKDAVKRGQVLSTVQDIFSALKENEYIPTAYTMELLDYLDNYCSKEKICESITSDDLSDLPLEERKRIVKTLEKLPIPPSF